MTLALVFGTRPEAIKLGPVAAELRELGVSPVIIGTGQHDTLLEGTPAASDLANATWLDLAAGLSAVADPKLWAVCAAHALVGALRVAKVTGVVVQGDTKSTLAGAYAAAWSGVPVFHVEAGLRSHDLANPWPEESIRRTVTQLAAWHYAPTTTAAANLRREGIPDDQILVTGNTSVSALERYAGGKLPDSAATDRTILVTMHRREALERIPACLEAAEVWAKAHPDAQVQWIRHPSVPSGAYAGRSALTISDPLPYVDTIATLRAVRGVATDSGGLQEEAATLGTPCVVLRTVSDRPESIAAGVARLSPSTPEGIAPALDLLWTRALPAVPSSCYGYSTAARQIATHLARLSATHQTPRPANYSPKP